MIQDIYPHKLYNEYDPMAKVQADSPILNIYDGKILVQTEKFDNNILEFPLKKELPDQLEYTYLFRVDDREYFPVSYTHLDSLIPEQQLFPQVLELFSPDLVSW